MSTAVIQSGPRERILGIASRLFYEQGYHATGINQIIREAQVAKASFYDHFSSKDDLALAYLEQRRARWLQALGQAAAAQERPQDKLPALFAFLEDWVAESGFRGCAFLNIASEFPSAENSIRTFVMAHKQAQWELFYSLVKEVKPDSAAAELRAVTNTIYLLFEGALTESRVFRSAWPVQAAQLALTQLLG